MSRFSGARRNLNGAASLDARGSSRSGVSEKFLAWALQ
jgi:hypothetical protein